ncbi:carboxypeptidase regulatory-like domain-containing protein [Bremerella sp. JC817]|uniref:carboxypeptidase regulatory-like domain-containing protein n=1 Tax=Bremerella sp. JC817 TaxID=3231756 RepID=UPI003459B9C7
MQTKTTWPAFGLAMLLFAAGCGTDSWKAPLNTVHGTISVNGQPADGAIVRLHKHGEPVDLRKSTPFGLADADGSFLVSTYKYNDGCPVGEYAVTLEWPDKQTSADRLKGKYRRIDKPLMEVTIESGSNELPPIVIEEVGVSLPGKPQ